MSKQYSRAVDPDPHSFCLQVPDPPPDTGGKLMKKKQKNAGKLVVTVILNCKFRPAPYFFLLQSYHFCLFQLKKTLHTVILYKFVLSWKNTWIRKK